MTAKAITRTDILLRSQMTVMPSPLWDEYGLVDKDLVDWCGHCFLQLNTLKNSGEAKDFRRTRPPSAVTAVIGNQSVTIYALGL